MVLFDGVCNLCNAAVQWIIAHERDGQLRFASLQSDIAERELRRCGIEVGQLPESIVVVEGDAVHSGSAAALVIARHLRLPFSLLRILAVVPRPLRDAGYAFVARNRYRWFGRQQTCVVPTPELAARFLDAGESTAARESMATGAAASADQDLGPRPWLLAWLPRFAIAYVVTYMAPFPLTLLYYLLRLPLVGDIPGLGTALGLIVGLYSRIVGPVVETVGRMLVGAEVVARATGSGDMTYHYVDLGVDAGLAVLIAIAWTFWARRRPLSARSLDVSQTLARYYLGTTMLTYGWIKTFPLQFSTPGPDRLIQPYGDSSPMGLAWTFLGASVGYQIFAGLAELLGGYLLFWRRTALLGALISAAVMTNVMAINFFFDVPVKLFSSHLVLMAVFIAAPELPRLTGMLIFNLPVMPRRVVPFWGRFGVRAGRVTAVHLVLIGGLTVFHVLDGVSASRTRGVLATPDPMVGVYRVETFTQAGMQGRDNDDAARWVRVGLNTFVTTIQRASGDAVRMRSVLDTEAATVSFFDRGAEPPAEPMFRYEIVEPGLVRLEGIFEGKTTTVVLRKNPAGALLTERGFRWINEYPFNR